MLLPEIRNTVKMEIPVQWKR